MSQQRIPYDKQIEVACPICGAPPGEFCFSRRYKIRWAGMPRAKFPHRERREYWIKTAGAGAEPEDCPGHKYYIQRSGVEYGRMISISNRETYAPRVAPEFGGILVCGEIVCDNPLAPYTSWSMDLIPANDAERAFHVFIERAVGCLELANKRLGEYLDMGEERLQSCAAADQLARAALAIMC